MTTISTIITDAFRESNLIAISASPTANETAEALRLLNRLVASILGNELGEDYSDVPYGSNNITRTNTDIYIYNQLIDNYFVPPNFRLILNLEEAKTIYLSPTPEDGSRFAVTDASGNLATYNLTVDGNGRQIEGATTSSLATNGLDREWFYRADLGDWKRATALVEADENPFPEKYDDLLIIGLAMRLNPRNAIALDAQSGEYYRRLMKQFKSQYKQTTQINSEYALMKFTGRPYRYTDYSEDGAFERGKNLW